MDDLLVTLEEQIPQLMHCYQLLKRRYEKLESEQMQLLREKELLQAKHKLAILQIENMVARLKSIEESA